MEIISRKEAKEAGLNKYYTGMICKNGHLDYRYVQSGSCQSCIRADHWSVKTVEDEGVLEAHAAIEAAKMALLDAKRAAEEKLKAAKRAAHDVVIAEIHEARDKVVRSKKARSNLILSKVRIFAAERESVALAAFALAAMRCPNLSIDDVDPQLAPTGREPAGTALYSFYCHGDDIAALQAAVAATFANHPTDIELKRRQTIQSAASYLPPDSTPPINFK